MPSEEQGPGAGGVRVECPRCPVPVAETGDGRWSCPDHGVVVPLWRTVEASYDAFAAHLQRVDSFPTYLPWPLGPGWSVSDFAAVAPTEGPAHATMTCVSGTSQARRPGRRDGGQRGARHRLRRPHRRAGRRGRRRVLLDPGHEIDGPAPVRVRADQYPVGLWPVSVSTSPGEWDRSVLAGEAGGRWLWLVLRPASAILLLRDDWILRDVSATGPRLVALPFGGATPSW
ncbi:DUF6758 family protein [Nocardioides convexus]|uniref:DUF6758 family protein n=1 Tax=Nocardioides convexus TaxID=2712224 RepID=UPI0024187402|nr:DUF6758 family protein [Nocardioides convexus]